jgi:uncharacterized protein with HEPN domain
MTQHDDWLSIQDMLQYAREAVAIVRGRVRPDLDRDRLLQLALVRLVEMIGEAAGRVSGRGRDAYPAIPWRQIVAMRNRLVHGYDDVDLDVLWNTITVDLPSLILELERLVTGRTPPE